VFKGINRKVANKWPIRHGVSRTAPARWRRSIGVSVATGR
jgi:hypothetical protein